MRTTNVCPDLDHIQKRTISFLTEMIPRSTKKEVYTDYNMLTMDASDHDLCCTCTNHNEVHKSEVYSHFLS